MLRPFLLFRGSYPAVFGANTVTTNNNKILHSRSLKFVEEKSFNQNKNLKKKPVYYNSGSMAAVF